MRPYERLCQEILTAIDNRRDEIIDIGRHIWANPEAGYHEVKTSAYVADKLRSLGLAPRTGYSITGMRADYTCAQPGPTIAILGEMDSLLLPTHPDADPVTGAAHACGHNGIIAGMLGAAMAVTDTKAAAELAGKIAFIACPAEECIETEWRGKLIREGKINALGGKASLILDGVFDDVDISFMNHLASSGHFGATDHNGFVMKTVTFHGKAAHAAGGPRNSINALGAANLALHALALLRETYSGDQYIRAHGIITSGGESVNIIPDIAKLEYQLRGETLEKIQKLSEKFDNAMKGCALAIGCTVDIDTYAGYMPLHNNKALCEVYKEAVLSLVPPDTKINIMESFSMGSTDMGDVATIIPAIHGYVEGAAGTGHGIDFRIDNEESAYVCNAKILALMAVRLLYGDAAKGREIAAQKANCMPIEDYKNQLKALNSSYSNYTANN